MEAQAAGNDVERQAGDLRLAAVLAYGLFLAAVVSAGGLAIVGLIVAYVKRGDARGTPYESHFSHLIGLFWTVFLLGVLLTGIVAWGIASAVIAEPHGDPIRFILLAPPAFIAYVALFIWYLYGTIKGLLRAIDGKAYA